MGDRFEDERADNADVIVIGAGFAGMYLIRLLRDRMGLDVVVIEQAEDVGGTWFWNRYPGARCDVESMFYSYSFDDELQQEWVWTERYPSQPELLDYLNHVADRFDLRRSIHFSTTVESAVFDEQQNTWRVRTDRGFTVEAPVLVTAVGCLSAPSVPEFPGLDRYRGELLHTGMWPRSPVDFVGKRVAVIGTGSSGVQAIPEIASQAESLTVFQRTATFVVPARNRPLSDVERAVTKRSYPALREAARHSRAGVLLEMPIGSGNDLAPDVLDAELERRWWRNGHGVTATVSDLLVSEESNQIVSEFVRRKINEIVEDPDVAKRLEPHDYAIGTKRISLGTDYYETYNLPHVSLVSIRDTPVETFTEGGLVVDGQQYEFDAVVLATGYDALTGALNRLDIRGTGGGTLREAWEHGPTTYLGIGVHGFPNFFMVTGPGSPSVFTNMVASIEQHVEWIADHLAYMRAEGFTRAEVEAAAQEAWVAHVNELADQTLLPRAASWYLGANIPGKPRVFMPYIGGAGTYRDICDDVARNGYRGFTHTREMAGDGREDLRVAESPA
jgi:cyclohexanone monooxygenase